MKQEYKIGGITFKSKKDIIIHTRNVVNNIYNKKRAVEDSNFLFALLRESTKDLTNLDSVFVDYDKKYNKNLCIFLKYKNGTVDDFSYYKCIENLKQIGNPYNFKFNFGKYKGQLLSNIFKFDFNYIQWILDTFETKEGKTNFKELIMNYMDYELKEIASPKEKEPKDIIIQLTIELQSAISVENFEKAALLRDKILELQNK